MIGGIWKDENGNWWVNEAHMKPDFANAKDGAVPVKMERSVRAATAEDIAFWEWLNDGK